MPSYIPILLYKSGVRWGVIYTGRNPDVWVNCHNMSRNMRKPTMWILTRSDTNQAVQQLEMSRGLKFCIEEGEVLYYPSSENKGAERYCTIQVAKTKALIIFAVTAKLICVFVFAYADCWFSNDADQLYVIIINLIIFIYLKIWLCLFKTDVF